MKHAPAEQRTTASPKPILWRVTLGAVALAAVILWVASILDLQRVWQSLQTVNYLLALSTAVPVIASHLMRAVRWRTMLRAVPELKPLPLHDLFAAVMVGYTANNIIPRSGEVLRPFVAARRSGVPVTLLLASVLAERFIDVIQLLFFLGIGILFLPDLVGKALPQWMVGEGLRSLAIVVLVLTAVIVVLGVTTIGERVAIALVRLFSRALAERLTEVFTSFRRGLRVVRDWKDVLAITWQSVAIWLLYATPLWVMFSAMHFSQQSVPQWTFWHACVLLFVSAVGTAIAPTPGAIGVVHAAVAEAMHRLYAVPLEEAFVYITVAHAVNYASVMVVGAIYCAREGMSLATLLRPTLSAEIAPSANAQTSA